MKLKKLTLSMGALATIVAPVATIIACGDNNNNDNDNTESVDNSFDFTNDLAKLEDQDSTKTEAVLKSELGQRKADDLVTANELGIELPSDFSDGVKIGGIVVVTPYSNHTIKIRVNLLKGDENGSKEITITAAKQVAGTKIAGTSVRRRNSFYFGDDLARLGDEKSTKTGSNLNSDIGSKNQGDNVSEADLGITSSTLWPNLDSKIYEIKVAEPYDSNTKSIKVKITLGYGPNDEEKASRNIVVYASDYGSNLFDFEPYLTDLHDIHSSFEKAELESLLKGRKTGYVVADEALGVEMHLTDLLSDFYHEDASNEVELKIHTPYDSYHETVQVDVILKKGDQSAQKTITISAGENYQFIKAFNELDGFRSSKNDNELAVSIPRIGMPVYKEEVSLAWPGLGENIDIKAMTVSKEYDISTKSVELDVTLINTITRETDRRIITIFAHDAPQ